MYFLEQRVSSKEKQKWVTKMLGYDFEIVMYMVASVTHRGYMELLFSLRSYQYINPSHHCYHSNLLCQISTANNIISTEFKPSHNAHSHIKALVFQILTQKTNVQLSSLQLAHNVQLLHCVAAQISCAALKKNTYTQCTQN